MPTSGSPPTRRVALVTGGARRIGAAIARTLHTAGYDLALHCHTSRAEMDTLLAELESARAGSTLGMQADLGEVERVPELVARTVARFGRLDALVNNASSFYPTTIGATTPAHWDGLFAINARAPFFLAQAAAPHLKASGGAIVNVADIYAEQPRADLLAYSASKAALIALTRGLASALAPEVRVNAVAPGAILWPGDGVPGPTQRALLAKTPLGRIGEAVEVANAVAWLLSGATYTSGEVVRVDGGRSIG